MLKKTKILLIRFSSFGDVVQSLSLPSVLRSQFPNSEIHWVTKNEFTGLIETHPAVNKVWGLNNKQGFNGLLILLRKLRGEKFSLIYDAHNNLRSHIIVWGLFISWFFESAFTEKKPRLIRRSIFRWKRFLLFWFRKNLFEQPFSGQRDLLVPLQKWGISKQLPPAPQLFIKDDIKLKVEKILEGKGILKNQFVSLAPSAAHDLKKWPKEYWQELVRSWPISFVILGGPKDFFLAEIAEIAPHRIFNFAGLLSLEESAAVVELSHLLITNDTGLLHVAEQLGHLAVALMGPAPFGYPSRYETTLILEKKLDCKPCSKHGQGPCKNTQFHECLRGMSPQFVLGQAQRHSTLGRPQ